MDEPESTQGFPTAFVFYQLPARYSLKTVTSVSIVLERTKDLRGTIQKICSSTAGNISQIHNDPLLFSPSIYAIKPFQSAHVFTLNVLGEVH